MKKTYSYNPVPDDADELAKKHIIGIQGNIWREYMQTSERTDYQAFPRAMAIAETAWTQNANKDWKNFCERKVIVPVQKFPEFLRQEMLPIRIIVRLLRLREVVVKLLWKQNVIFLPKDSFNPVYIRP